MQNETTLNSEKMTPSVAYLVMREGRKWRDVFRLAPGQVTTIGRAPTNRIVLNDEICSRNHCEVFLSGSTWTLRELGSRNGTLVDGVRVAGDCELADGRLIEIGTCQLGFTYDISKPFPHFDREDEPASERDTAVDIVFDHPAEPEILQRKRKTRYHGKRTDSQTQARDGREVAALYRLTLEMGAAGDSRQLSELALEGLLEGTGADAGAILLCSGPQPLESQARQLRIMACRSPEEAPYQHVSEALSDVVLSEQEAILAREVADDSRLATRDSLGKIHAESVICAPIRCGTTVQGLIHLYSTQSDKLLNPDDLEFTLAVADQLALALEHFQEKESLASGLARVKDENETLRRQLEIDSELVGDSPTMRQLKEQIGRIAPTDASVLIRGESGVGKELVARAMHFTSLRRHQPFVCMNCAALSENLLESELFGHEKGAFTGAVALKIGKFEQADRGTLFLDEVGEMGLGIQANFLRVLEGHEFERVGGHAAIDVDVRVVAATNRELESAVEQGTFRKDLYFRLQVVEIQVQALRNHSSDIPRLANYFLDRYVRKTGRPVKAFTNGALQRLLNYSWPGNIRELQNTVERAVILCAGELVREADIQLSTLGKSTVTHAEEDRADGFRPLSLEVLEQEHILATLSSTNWNKSQAAQILGIERSTLDRKLKRYQVSRPKT